MSVINTMLKDLDKRQQSHELENLHVAPVQYQSVTPSKLPWILLGLVTLVLVSGIVFSWDRLTAKVSDDTEILSVDKQAAATPVTDNTLVDNKVAENTATENKPGTIDEPRLTPMAAPSISAENRASSEDKLDSIEPDIDAGVTVNSEQPLTKETSTSEQASRPEAESGSKAEFVARPITKEQQAAVVKEALTVIVSKKQSETAAPLSQAVKVEAPVARTSNNGSMAVTEVKLSDEQLAQKRLTLATEAEQLGEQNDAIVYYIEALTLNPKLHQARKQLAALYYGKARLDLATDLLRQGSSQFPLEFDYLLLLARVQQASGNQAQALSILSQIPDTSLLARQKWVEQSSLAQEVSNFVLAEQGYRNLLGVEANQARWWMGLAYSLDAQAKYSAAKDAYKQAVLYKSVPRKGLSVQALEYIENRLAQLGEIE
ncbi:MSHA biogenesis protein MshN [Shewanella canadensis]|uniref:MSHA biogenesis protein MshN n=1 Tax=Shewanella canadensis TaxID=271096 RepID=A0A431WYW4_9GAMM|nr:MSHA biogenesis protein MshN [Shewanella canadensis]RTR40463.1 MSHA biogenesis protein MshN [Shewanella canadensis]